MAYMTALEGLNETTNQPPRRWRRLIFRAISWAGIVAAALLLLEKFLLPAIVQHEVAGAFEQLGLRDVKFTVRDASIRTAEIADVRFGSGEQARVSRITVGYSPIRVIGGTLDSIAISGAEI